MFLRAHENWLEAALISSFNEKVFTYFPKHHNANAFLKLTND